MTPTRPADKQLQEYLFKMTEMMTNIHRKGNTPLQYYCIEHAVLELGKFHTSQELPKPYKYRKQKLCFQNAYQLADSTYNLTYVEGVATIGLVPVHHAWCVDGNDMVIDPTWRPDNHFKYKDWAYCGIKFNIEFVNKIILSKGTYGIFDYMERGKNNPCINGFPKGAIIQ